ncbi:MAG: C25 family cysteine peptidase [Dokdonella sp.]
MPLTFLVRAFALLLFVAPLPLLACTGQLHIELEHAGVYALDHAAIAAAQPALADCTAADLILTQAGKDVPIRVVARGERFAEGDHIEWIGQALHGPESWYDAFSVNNVYLLGSAPGAHARMRDVDATERGHATLQRVLHVEQENLMIRLDQTQQKPGEEPDVWQWAKLTQVDPQPFETHFDLPDLDTHVASMKLSLAFRGLSDINPPLKEKDRRPDDHFVEITINGHVLAPVSWNGRDEVRRELEIAIASLKTHDNVLTLHVPKRALPWMPTMTAVDVVMFNWLEACYPIGGDLDSGAQPFSVRADATQALQLGYRGEGVPMLYGSDGLRRPGQAFDAGRYAFAPAAAGIELFPAIDGKFARPLALRAVADRDWLDATNGYDYLIVAHPKLIDAIRPLAAFHERRGLKVAVFDVNAVYDQFNHGITHPQAIRNLVETAQRQWTRKPRFLLLVGDASFDIRHDTYNDLNYAKWTDQELLFPGHFGAVPGSQYKEKPGKLADRNLIPTWQYPSPEGQSASDNWYGALGDDWHPVVAVGRFPVVEPAEVKAIVDKTIAYLSTPQLGAWRRDVMFITDEIDSFKQASDEIATALGKDGFLADKVYASPLESDNASHQTAIHDGIDEGRLLVHFIGHGGRYIWRTGPPDLHKNADLFTLDDVSALKNGARLPMVLSMTCYSAPFDNPTEDSIGERFLREPGKGAIAVFAASWRNSPSPAYSKAVVHELLEPGATIGEAIVRAKKSSKDRTLVEMYNLLGDPAVVLERPRDAARVALDGARWSPGVLVDLGVSRFEGNVNVDWLDAKGTKLASSDYHANDARFRLPVPSIAGGKIAQVRVYAASLTTGRDAVGGIDFDKALTQAGARRPTLAQWWRELFASAPKASVVHPDTITVLGFDAAPPLKAPKPAAPSTPENSAR